MSLKVRVVKLFISALIGGLIWQIPTPAAVDPKGWQLFAIFISTILVVMLDALPMGAGTLIGLTVAVFLGVLPFQEAFVGFSSDVTWLVLIAFFIAYGFIHTGLGTRIAYVFVRFFGKSTLGLGYGITLTELLLAPAIPSMTARSGGVVYPITQSLAQAFHSRPEDGTSRKIGSYLILVAFQAAVITSAMFLTAMAANPLAARLALQQGVEITWSGWALGALVPGLCSLILMPWLMYRLYPPELKKTPHAVEYAKQELKRMGRMKPPEMVMLVVFIGLLILWSLGSILKIPAVVAALLGLSILILLDVVKWQDLLKQHAAFETFFWFAILLSMAEGLSKYGLAAWFGESIGGVFAGTTLWVAALGLFLVYFYCHYFFASSVAHVGALYIPFLIVLIKLGTPPLPTALILGYASNLFGGITHYGCGPAPVLFGSGYVRLREWWLLGFIFSVINIAIWLGVGSIWWKFLGYI